MHLSRSRKSTALIFFVVLIALGCGSQTPGPAKPSAGTVDKGLDATPMEAGALPKWTAADQGKGYLHKESGIGFIFPEGWEILGTRTQGPITQLGLRKGEAFEVTLYWTALDRGQESGHHRR